MIIIAKEGEELGNVPRFGLAESEISHSRGLITKSEVRAAVIHRLCLPETGIFWDVGAGSGSISLEVSRLYKGLNVFAVEKEEEQLANIQANMSRYRSDNVRIIAGEAPEILHRLPPPDSVFVGGSGGRLEEILSFLSTAVKDTTRIVITAVLEETARLAPEILHRYDFNVDISLIQVTRFSYPEKSGTPFNPIHIISAGKNR
jgi:precorrin-6Y C5,15-methyltransferase (decarboxylating)